MKPAKIQQIRNRLTFADEVGGAFNRFNGVDVTVNARLRDVTIQGGTSTGNVVEDSCGVVTENPEYYIFSLGRHGRVPRHVPRRRRTVAAAVLPSRVGMEDEHQGAGVVHGAEDRRADQRDVQEPALSRERIPVGAEPEPRWAGAGVPGIPGVDSTSLGRPLSSGIPVQFLNIVEPGKWYGDRLSSIDLRFGKILSTATRRTMINFDIYNLFNSNTTEVFQRNYSAPTPPGTTPRSTYLDPLSIMSARLFKISAQFDF